MLGANAGDIGSAKQDTGLRIKRPKGDKRSTNREERPAVNL